MRSLRLLGCPLMVSLAMLVASCGGSPLVRVPPPVSQGLKIFVTARAHGGDFLDDPFLAGANAIAKADVFCNTDSAKPSAATYKALLVDGVNRNAKTLLDWVLKPNTAYYQTHGDVLIGTTTPAAIFGAAYQPLVNPIMPLVNLEVWTGIASASDFSSGNDCNHWSAITSSYLGQTGYAWGTNGFAFATSGGANCYGAQFPIYCVEQ